MRSPEPRDDRPAGYGVCCSVLFMLALLALWAAVEVVR